MRIKNNISSLDDLKNMINIIVNTNIINDIHAFYNGHIFTITHGRLGVIIEHRKIDDWKVVDFQYRKDVDKFERHFWSK